MRAVGFVLFGVAVAIAVNVWAMDRRGKEGQEMSRACQPGIGDVNLTAAATTGSDADVALTAGVVYYVLCDTKAWLRWCSSATCTAAVDDFLLPADTLFPFATGTTSANSQWPSSETLSHMSALSHTSDGDCRLHICR